MLEGISYRLFGPIVRPYVGYFEPLQNELKRADIKVPVDVYLSKLFFASMLAFMITTITLSGIISYALLYPAYSYTLAIILASLAATLTFLSGYWYPSLKAKTLQREINKALPFAAFYMTTVASSGTNPLEIFRILSLRGGVIGNEARKIYTNVKSLGLSLTTAIQRVASKTPSPEFADLLWGMISVITAGGDLEEYLKSKSEALMSKYRRSLTDYAKSISFYTEIYITLIIVGSLFFIVLISIVAPVTGISVLFLQTFLVFFFIPLISIAYIILLKSISPLE